jgi:hypothetical protein
MASSAELMGFSIGPGQLAQREQRREQQVCLTFTLG